MRMASLRTFKLPQLLEREQLKALRGPDSELQIWGFLSLKHRGRTSPTGVPTNFSKSILDEIEDEIIAGD